MTVEFHNKISRFRFVLTFTYKKLTGLALVNRHATHRITPRKTLGHPRHIPQALRCGQALEKDRGDEREYAEMLNLFPHEAVKILGGLLITQRNKAGT